MTQRIAIATKSFARLSPAIPQDFIPACVETISGRTISMSGETRTSLCALKEHEKLRKRIGDFTWDGTEVKRWIARSFGRDLKQFELQQIANKVLELVKADDVELYHRIDIDREEKRRKVVLQKWYDTHFAEIRPYLERLVVQDSDGVLYGPAKERAVKALKAMCK